MLLLRQIGRGGEGLESLGGERSRRFGGGERERERERSRRYGGAEPADMKAPMKAPLLLPFIAASG